LLGFFIKKPNKIATYKER